MHSLYQADLKILVIDPCEENYQKIVRLTEDISAKEKNQIGSIEYAYFKDIDQAIYALKQCPMDLILMNLFQQDLQGIDSILKIKYSITSINIIVYTNQFEKESLETIKNGVQDYINLSEDSPYHIIKSMRYAYERFQIEKNNQSTLKKAEMANNVKSNFLTNLSHELRSPINGIFANTEMLRNTKLDLEQKGLSETIFQSTHNLFNTVNSVLDIARLESRDIKIDSKAFDFKQETSNLPRLLQAKLRKQNSDLEIIYSNKINHHYYGDIFKIRQILMNIISSVIKNKENQKLTLTIRKDITLTEGIEIELLSRDEKINSIQKEILDKVFSQHNSDVFTEIGLAQIDLSLSIQLCNLINGSIRYQSNNEGIYYYISLPLKAVENVSLPNKEKQTTDDFIEFGKKNILVIEDSMDIQSQIRNYLKGSQIKLTMVKDGEEAVQKLMESQFDMVLLDCFIPIIDGFHVTRIIRVEQNPNISSPIIAITSKADSDSILHCINSGMNDYITKPIERNNLISIFEKFLY